MYLFSIGRRFAQHTRSRSPPGSAMGLTAAAGALLSILDALLRALGQEVPPLQSQFMRDGRRPRFRRQR
jgi:hypothetical protein